MADKSAKTDFDLNRWSHHIMFLQAEVLAAYTGRLHLVAIGKPAPAQEVKALHIYLERRHGVSLMRKRMGGDGLFPPVMCLPRLPYFSRRKAASNSSGLYFVVLSRLGFGPNGRPS